MRKKLFSKFKGYLIILFILFIILFIVLTGCYDGFYDGFMGLPYEQTFKVNWGKEIAFALIAISLAFIFYGIIYKKTVQPIEEITENMIKITKGDLSARVSENAQYEFLQIERCFNDMAGKLEASKRLNELNEENNHQLYASIAHDLKTPMTMVMGYARALSRQDIKDEEKKLEFLNTIFDQTRHANELLDSLLEYTKLENGQYEMKKEKGNLSECLRECIAGYFTRFEEKEMELEVDIPDQDLFYTFDKLEINRVFYNLLSNMVKHNKVGTGCLIRMSLDEIEQIEISFADNGTPIDINMKDNLFDPFAVGDASRNTKGGSGLGLSVVQKIIEKHGGRITYQEKWEDGKKAFVIQLPMEGSNK